MATMDCGRGLEPLSKLLRVAPEEKSQEEMPARPRKETHTHRNRKKGGINALFSAQRGVNLSTSEIGVGQKQKKGVLFFAKRRKSEYFRRGKIKYIRPTIRENKF